MGRSYPAARPPVFMKYDWLRGYSAMRTSKVRVAVSPLASLAAIEKRSSAFRSCPRRIVDARALRLLADAGALRRILDRCRLTRHERDVALCWRLGDRDLRRRHRFAALAETGKDEDARGPAGDDRCRAHRCIRRGPSPGSGALPSCEPRPEQPATPTRTSARPAARTRRARCGRMRVPRVGRCRFMMARAERDMRHIPSRADE